MSSAKPSRVRHRILGLTVLVYFITYLDRVLISNALPSIQKEFGFSIETAGLVMGCYAAAYFIFQIPGGWFGDKFGPRIALASVVTWWSAFTFFTGLSTSLPFLMVCLFLIGMGEAGAFPFPTADFPAGCCPANAASPRAPPMPARAWGGRPDAGAGGDPDRPLQLAHALLPVRGGGHRLGGACGTGITATFPANIAASMKASATESYRRWAMPPRSGRRFRGG